MDSSGLHGMAANARDSFGRLLGSGDGYEAFERRRQLKRWGTVAAAILLLALIGVAGYSIGSKGVGDADAYSQAGARAGKASGTALGAREGYEAAFVRARERAYHRAYREAYASAYRDAFTRADLQAPRTVKVSGP